MLYSYQKEQIAKNLSMLMLNDDTILSLGKMLWNKRNKTIQHMPLEDNNQPEVTLLLLLSGFPLSDLIQKSDAHTIFAP